MKSARRVARPSRTGKTPEAMGSSVPAWPTRFCDANRRTLATTSCEVQPFGLSTFRMPARSGLVAMLALLFDRPYPAHNAVSSSQGWIEDELEMRRIAQVEAFFEVAMEEA